MINVDLNVVWDVLKWLEVPFANFFCPTTQWKKLKDESDHLKFIKADVSIQSNEQMRIEPLMVVKEEVKVWARKVDEVVVAIDEDLCPRAESWSFREAMCCCSNYDLGDNIHNSFIRVSSLKDQHASWNDKLVIPSSPQTIEEALKSEIENLKARRYDSGREIQKEILQEGVIQSEEATLWLQNVDDLCDRYKFHCLEEIVDVEEHERDFRCLLMNARNLHNNQPGCLVVPHYPLEETLEKLTRKRNMLDDAKKDLQNEVEQKEKDDPFMQRSYRVKRWLEDAAHLSQRIDDFLRLIGSDWNARNSYQRILDDYNLRILMKATNKVSKVDELLNLQEELGQNLVILQPLPESKPWSSTKSVVGLEENKMEVLALLKDESKHVIGIHGMGGIGKTTLLREIAYENCLPFDTLIFVVVSKTPDIFKIQEDIAVALGYKRAVDGGAGQRLDSDVRDRADTLCRALSQRKFLLLLDDVWKKLDLDQVGIPALEAKNSKVVITTREVTVCTNMHAEQVKVGFLNETHSQLLFRQAVNDDKVFDKKGIEVNAREIVKKCGGLPLLLLTVGKAMADKKHEADWRNANQALKYFPDDIDGMTEVYRRLKFSFDNLKTDIYRSCLLFCCLFPEDANISIDELVDYWIGEGVFSNNNNSHGFMPSLCNLRDMGKSVVQVLQSSSLLEQGDKEECVKLHDAVREMGIWLGNGNGGDNFNHKFLSLAGKGQKEITINRKWKEVERISLMRNNIVNIKANNFDGGGESSTNHPNLLTLLIGSNSKLGQLQFDRLMSHLLSSTIRVLDLSGIMVQHFPTDCKMNALGYLNLAWSLIEELNLMNLPCLQQLDLSFTKSLVIVSRPATNSNLRSLKLTGSSYNIFNTERTDQFGLEDVLAMHQLQEFTVRVGYVTEVHPIDRLLESEQIIKAMTGINFIKLKMLTYSHISVALKKIEKPKEIRIVKCTLLQDKHITIQEDKLQDVRCIILDGVGGFSIRRRHDFHSFGNLFSLFIETCPTLENIQWLEFAPNLKHLLLRECKGLVNVLNDQLCSNTTPLSKLRELLLQDLPQLKHVCTTPLLSLHSLHVFGCPLLKKLPPLAANVQIWCETYKGMIWMPS